MKGFGVRKSKTAKSRTDKKVIRRRFVYKKEGHKIPDKDKRDKRCNTHERPVVAVQQE